MVDRFTVDHKPDTSGRSSHPDTYLKCSGSQTTMQWWRISLMTTSLTSVAGVHIQIPPQVFRFPDNNVMVEDFTDDHKPNTSGRSTHPDTYILYLKGSGSQTTMQWWIVSLLTTSLTPVAGVHIQIPTPRVQVPRQQCNSGAFHC